MVENADRDSDRDEIRRMRHLASEAVERAGPKGQARTMYSRELYEMACAAAGVEPLLDPECDRREVMNGIFEPPKYDARTAVQLTLSRGRAFGMLHERRRERRRWRSEMDQWYPRGLTREGYEAACAEFGIEAVPDERMHEVNGEYQQQVEIADLVPLDIELGGMRYTGLMGERRRRQG